MVGEAPRRPRGAEGTSGRLTAGVDDVHSQTRASPFVLLAVFGALSVGAIALSLSSAPPLAQEQLRGAAKATMSASGFVLRDDNSVVVASSSGQSVPNRAGQRVAFVVVYQAPDAVQETEVDQTGGNAEVIAVGDRAFRRTGSTWTEVASSPGLGARSVATILSPLQGAAGATAVTQDGDLYSFEPANLRGLLTTVLGAPPSEVSSPHLSAVVRDGELTAETITARVGAQRLEVDLVFSSIGSAPPVNVPRSFAGAGGA